MLIEFGYNSRLLKVKTLINMIAVLITLPKRGSVGGGDHKVKVVHVNIIDCYHSILHLQIEV